MMPLLEAMRPHQWIKNAFVLAPLIFARKLGDASALGQALIAVAVFCLVASAVYLFNDILDIERDRQHPDKCKRPLPSGRLSPKLAILSLVTLTLVGLGLAYWMGYPELPLAYCVLNICYSLRLKHMVILDAMCISIGFLLRVYTGGAAIGVEVSAWLALCTFFLALFLAFCKRRHELTILGVNSTQHRKALEEYSTAFLDQMIAPLGALTVFAYSVYTVSSRAEEIFGRDNKLYYTVPFVVYGIFRYLYLVHQRTEGGNPAKLLVRDKMMLVNVVAWMAMCLWVVYR